MLSRYGVSVASKRARTDRELRFLVDSSWRQQRPQQPFAGADAFTRPAVQFSHTHIASYFEISNQACMHYEKFLYELSCKKAQSRFAVYLVCPPPLSPCATFAFNLLAPLDFH